MRGILVLLSIVAAASAWDAQDWEPRWKQVCFSKHNGMLQPTLTPKGYCKGHGLKRVEQCNAGQTCDCDGGCTLNHGICVCATTGFVHPAESRCLVVSNGEMESTVSDSNPTQIYQYACFDQRGKIVHLTKPDGFCGVDRSNPQQPKPISHDCDADAACTRSLDGLIFACKANTLDLASPPLGSKCQIYTAVELSATVRGWPPAGF